MDKNIKIPKNLQDSELELILKKEAHENPFEFGPFWKEVRQKVNERKPALFFQRLVKTVIISAGTTAAVLIAVGVGFMQFMSWNTKPAIVAMVQGQIEVRHKGQAAWKPITINDLIKQGDSLRTKPDAACEITLPGKAVLVLKPSSEALFDKLKEQNGKRETSIDLKEGTLLARPAQLQVGESFQIATSTLQASVVGTKFLVTVDTEGKSGIMVGEGSVKVTPNLSRLEETEEYKKLDDQAKIWLKNEVAGAVHVKAGESLQVEEKSVEMAVQSAQSNLKISLGSEKDGVTLIVLTNRLPASSLNQFEKSVLLKPLEKAYSDELDKLPDTLSESAQIKMIKVSIQSQPVGVKVYEGASYSGTTPFERMMPANTALELRVDYNGQNGVPVTNVNFDKDTVLDLNLPLLLPGLANVTIEKPIWEKTLADSAQFLNIVVYAGLTAVSRDNAFSIYSADGVLLGQSRVNLPDAILTKAAYDTEKFYCGSENGGLFAFDRKGGLVWSVENAGQSKYNDYPVAGSGYVVLPVFDKGLEVYTSTGKKYIDIPVRGGDSIYAAPHIVKSKGWLIYGTEKGRVACYDLNEKKELWSRDDLAERIIYPLVGDDSVAVILIRSSGKVLALDTRTGKTLWSKELQVLKQTDINPISRNGKLLLAGSAAKATVFVLELKNGSVITSVEQEGRLVSIEMNAVVFYCQDQKGNINGYHFTNTQPVQKFDPGISGTVMAADNDALFTMNSVKLRKIGH